MVTDEALQEVVDFPTSKLTNFVSLWPHRLQKLTKTRNTI